MKRPTGRHRVNGVLERVHIDRRSVLMHHAGDSTGFADELGISGQPGERILGRRKGRCWICSKDSRRVHPELALHDSLVLQGIEAARKTPVDKRPAVVASGSEDHGNPAEEATSKEVAWLVWNFETIDDRSPEHTCQLSEYLEPAGERRQG